MTRDVSSFQRRLGSRIQTLRQRRGLTQDQLAHDCGLSQKYLSELERGEKSASLDTLIALAHDGFGIRVAALLVDVDADIEPQVHQLDELLAGWAPEARARILKAIGLLLDAGTRDQISRAAESSGRTPRRGRIR